MSEGCYLAGACVLILACLGMAADAARNLRRLGREEREGVVHRLVLSLYHGGCIK